MAWLASDRPDLVPAYERLYSRGSYVSRAYQERLGDLFRPLLARHGLGKGHELRGPHPADGEMPETTQLTLL
jgi:hypothetical protein